MLSLFAEFEGTVTAIAIAVGFIAQIVLQVMAKFEAREIKDRLAHTAREVKDDLLVATTKADEKFAELIKTGDKTHGLVNSNHLAQLKISAIALRRLVVALGEKATTEDEAAAREAERLFKDHEAKQAVVDGKSDKKEGES